MWTINDKILDIKKSIIFFFFFNAKKLKLCELERGCLGFTYFPYRPLMFEGYITHSKYREALKRTAVLQYTGVTQY